MKRCPKCNSLYKGEILYCLNDGTPLVEQDLPSAPTDTYNEPETIIRNEPIVINFSEPESSSEPILIDFSDAETVVHQPKNAENIPQAAIVKKPVSKINNYALFLILGLLIGGGLVLITLFLAGSFNQGEDVNSNNAAPFEKTVSTSETSNSETIQTAASKHETRTETAVGDSLNGRVIALNAYVRSSPAQNAAEIDVLQVDDRLDIERRENENSPWFYVICEHGTSGWMHGNTIAYTK